MVKKDDAHTHTLSRAKENSADRPIPSSPFAQRSHTNKRTKNSRRILIPALDILLFSFILEVGIAHLLSAGQPSLCKYGKDLISRVLKRRW